MEFEQGTEDFGRCAFIHLFHLVGVLHAEVVVLAEGRDIDAPRVFAVGCRLLQGKEVGKVAFVEAIGLAEIAAGIQLVVPNFLRGCALVEEEDDGLHACPLEHTAGEVEDGVEVALLLEQLTERRGIEMDDRR